MRKVFVVFLCTVAVLLAGYAGYRGYEVWKSSHLINLAHVFLAKSDRKNALLCAQQVLRSDPRNLEATRLMAELAEASHSSSALRWRRRVVELNPLSLNDRLALATTAMQMHDYSIASNALDGVGQDDKNTVAFHNIAGAVAAASGHAQQAESEFLQAERQDPQNQFIQLNLAVVRLHYTNSSVSGEARAALKQLSSAATNSVLRYQALRELASDALRRKEGDEALVLSKLLSQDANATFGDRLLRLEVMRDFKNAELAATLAAFQREAARDPGKICELANWQMNKMSPAETLAWLRSLPAMVQTNQPVALMVVACYTMQGDWRGLQVAVERENWADSEFLRHAILSLAFRGQNLTGSSKAEWELALKESGGQRQNLVMLLGLVTEWKWINEGEDLLWIIVNHYPNEKWAMQSLSDLLFADGRTRSLMELVSQKLKREPSDVDSKNNLALLALLLDAQEMNPNQLAWEVYRVSPTNAAYASTYAFSLYLQKKNREALKVIEKLKPEELESPSIAGYYGLILKANGKAAKAAPFLELASKAHLLPEERRLFDRAKDGV